MTPLAFIDAETTGLDPARHEILEVGVIRVRGDTFEEVDRTDVRVQPERIEDADPEALRVNGWSDEAWEHAVSLSQALEWIAPHLDGACLAGHNVGFDRAFLDAAWRSTGVARPAMDHHVLDTATLAWPLLAAGVIDSLSLDPVCAHLGIDRTDPHRALADASRSMEVARRLLPGTQLSSLVGALRADERSMVQTLLRRMHAGRRDYGAWHTDDGRDYPREALHEVIDALNYCAAELVRMGRRSAAPTVRTRRVYVCHPYAGDVPANTVRVRSICRALVESGFVPVAPHLYLPAFLDEATERETALALCLELVGTCDEVRVYGGSITAGMMREIERAEALGLPVRFVDAEAA